MFIPHSRQTMRAAQQPVPPKALAVVVAVAATVLMAGLAALLQNSAAGDTGGLTAAGLLIAGVAAGSGFVAARVIGRQGRI